MKKIVVLVSGNGSNLQAIIDACQNGKIAAQIAAVVSNKPGVYALERAQLAHIPTHVIDHHTYATREQFDVAVANIIDQYQPDLIVLAGYMRILTASFVEHYAGKMLNIHPSLLPKYPGLNTHQRAIDAKDSVHGTTVHFVTEQLDGGPIILQAKVPIFPEDEVVDIAQRVVTQEHLIYPLVIKWFIDGRLQMRQDKAYLDDQLLPELGFSSDD
ncbi:phosphoribosylglycinamide formyltransferase [Utexia brackfieldae]|uniref:phosphoribosylglycinamide formyltransferase n=1 Tax=Utexia brackfieldae TaxID=3074108 RepID=UPI00370DCE70